MRKWTLEHDGLEIYALYLLGFGCIATVLLVAAPLTRAISTSTRYYVFLAVAALVAIVFLRTVGFVPPLEEEWDRHSWWVRAAVPAAIFAACCVAVAFLRVIERAFGSTAMYAAIALGLIPICFIAYEPFSIGDYAYVLAPALRVLQGAPLRELYLQYDLLLSLVAAAWLKLGIEPNIFYLLMQASYYGFFIAAFALSRRLFADKVLALAFLLSVVVIRVYCGLADPAYWIQVTPLRLDWWLVFLILVYINGPYHWTVGVLGGALVFVHRNFGVIYSLAYCELLVTLFWLDCLDAKASPHPKASAFGGLLKAHVRKIVPNVLIIAAAACAGVVVFYGDRAGSVFLYQRIGLGFLQIARNSFYWYAFVLIAIVPIVLLKSRQVLTRQYLTAGFFLTYLAIGNSIYFFGRSHEANVIHVSGALILLLFVGLDAAGRCISANTPAARQSSDQSLWRSAAVGRIGAALFVMLISWSYGGTIATRIAVQLKTLARRDFIVPFGQSKAAAIADLDAVRAVTDGEAKVHFLVGDGFLLSYYGHYRLPGYFHPYKAWVFKDDLLTSLQQEIDAGYYIVCDQGEFVGKELAGLRYTDAKASGRFVIISGPRRPQG